MEVLAGCGRFSTREECLWPRFVAATRANAADVIYMNMDDPESIPV